VKETFSIIVQEPNTVEGQLDAVEMSSSDDVKRLGYWLTAKKLKKLSVSDIEESLR
jgi:hypothetical protein